MMSKSIPLRKWVDGALEAIDVSALVPDESFTSSFGADPSSWPADVRRSKALSSDSFLRPALKIARSLASQICLAEDDGGRRGSMTPSPDRDLAERITVHLSNDPIDVYEGDLQPLPFSSQNPCSDPRELQNMLTSLIPDDSLFGLEDNAVDGAPISESQENFVPFNNVAGAEIVPYPNDDNNSLNLKNKMQCIYSLGIVFYEFFSGGERHPDITPQINSYPQSTNKSSGMKDNGEPIPYAGQAYETIARGDSCTFDLAGKLNILDRMGDIGDAFEYLDDGMPFDNDGQVPNKKKGPKLRSRGMSSVSVEPLKLKGLPVKLCDLISNMIDCVNGDLSGEEAYRNMSDVYSDLQLMLDKPSRFLHDMDLEKLLITGLQLNEALFDREMDFSSLQNSYKRSISGENECAIIVGPSGIGKSVLAHRLGSFASANGGLFLSGKFDQLPHAKPFSALASAFNDYCFKMSIRGRSSHLQVVASKLKIALGREALHLVKVIPNLSIILGEQPVEEDLNQECVYAQTRLQYLLCQFVCVISSFSGAPVILFLDDLQWADEASISAITQLMLVSGSLDAKRQFFFLGCSREEGMLDHPFGNMLSAIRHFGVHTTIVKLSCMDKEMTNMMVSDLLCLSPRLTRTLSDIIFHKTKGNPLFFSQLVISLSRDGLIRLSLSRRRWEWDEEKIQFRKLPDDVAAFLTSSLERLPEEVQRALSTLSFFGASSNKIIIEALETKFGDALIGPLEIALAEGVLDKINGSYCFSHDRLQEAAYNMIQPEDRCFFHFKYGVALVPLSIELQDDDILFIVASQINRGGPEAVEDIDQAVLIANLNLTAGHKAMEMSDFSSAYSFFDNGISFLRKNHWKDYYDLSLRLFEVASKCALALGDIIGLKLLSEQIFTFSNSSEAKLNAMYNTVSALAYAFQIPLSVKSCMVALAELGEELPDSYSESDTKFYIEQTKIMLKGFATDASLIEYKKMEDPSKMMVMKFYASLELSFQITKVEAQPIVTMKMVQLSIARGMSPMSPIGFTYFGQLLARLGNIHEGCRYVKIGRKLLDRLGSKEVAGEVIATGTQILCFVEPVQATLENHVHGHETAMKAGDTHGAFLNSLLYIPTLFWSGAKLSVCREQYALAHRLMEKRNDTTMLAHMGELGENLSLLAGSNDVLDNQAAQDLRETNPHLSYTLCFHRMYIRFMFREYEDTKALAEKYFDFNLRNWVLLYIHTAHTFYGGLVACWVYRQSKDPKWAGRAREAKIVMKNWADCNEHNFQSKLCLMEAEEAFCENDIDKAENFYEMAISSARKHRFINEEALAHELAGYFFLEAEKKDTAVKHLLQAHEKYHNWGAVAKSNSLFEFVQCVLGTSISLDARASPFRGGAGTQGNPLNGDNPDKPMRTTNAATGAGSSGNRAMGSRTNGSPSDASAATSKPPASLASGEDGDGVRIESIASLRKGGEPSKSIESVAESSPNSFPAVPSAQPHQQPAHPNPAQPMPNSTTQAFRQFITEKYGGKASNPATPSSPSRQQPPQPMLDPMMQAFRQFAGARFGGQAGAMPPLFQAQQQQPMPFTLGRLSNSQQDANATPVVATAMGNELKTSESPQLSSQQPDNVEKNTRKRMSKSS